MTGYYNVAKENVKTEVLKSRTPSETIAPVTDTQNVHLADLHSALSIQVQALAMRIFKMGHLLLMEENLDSLKLDELHLSSGKHGHYEEYTADLCNDALAARSQADGFIAELTGTYNENACMTGARESCSPNTDMYDVYIYLADIRNTLGRAINIISGPNSWEDSTVNEFLGGNTLTDETSLIEGYIICSKLAKDCYERCEIIEKVL